MSDEKNTKEMEKTEVEVLEEHQALSRRGFIASTIAGGAIAGGAITLPLTMGSNDAQAKSGGNSPHVDPGKLDKYYGFWSGGQSGEVRCYGVPSMRELKRIPVFNFDCTSGYGITDRSKKMLGDLKAGDTHHVHLSYDKGTYDGKYIYVNDKLNARLARVRIDYLETDAMVDLPNCQGTHGIFPQRVRRKNKPYLVFCNAEFRTPMKNDGRGLEDVKNYGALHTAVDGEKMKVLWQVHVSGNMDLCATDHKGLYSMATCYNSEEGATLNDMTKADQDWLVVFNTASIEGAVAAGKAKKYGNKVPVVDALKGGKGEGKHVIYIPVPKSPHGVNMDPTGKYAIVSGKLSPLCSVIDMAKVELAFAGKIKPEDCIIAQPEVGLGPLHTAFDDRGNAYTSIFIDSVITKWNIEDAIKQYAGKKVDPIKQKIPVHYQPGHINGSMSETNEADGKWIVALCKFSKDRFLPVGPRRSDNDQLIDISGEKMKLVHDGAVHPEPHDCVIVRRDIIQSKVKKKYNIKDPMFDMYHKMAKEDGVNLRKDNKVIRKGRKVRVYMTASAPNFGLEKFTIKKGDTVTVIVTNRDRVEDLSHSLSICQHDINFSVNPGEVNSATFKAKKAGLFWFYCSWFCHALHLEMRGRMLVEK
jgi:nitrous-oxide reductase